MGKGKVEGVVVGRHVLVLKGNEFEKQLNGLKPDQFAVVLFSDKGCVQRQGFEREFARFAASGKGAYLFLCTGNKDIVNRYGVTRFPHVKIFDPRGVNLDVIDRKDIFGELARYHIGGKERAVLLRGRFTDPQADVRTAAIEAYGLLANELDTTELSAAFAALRARFDDPDAGVRKAAVETFGKLSLEVSPDEMAECVRGIKARFDDLDPGVRRSAIEVYRSLADEGLDSSTISVDVGAIRMRFEDIDPYVRRAAIRTYGSLAWRMRSNEVIRGIKLLTAKNADPDPDVRDAATKALESLAVIKDLAIEDMDIWSRFEGPEIVNRRYVPRYVVLKQYETLSHKLTAGQAAEGIEKIRPLLIPHEDYNLLQPAIDIYRSLIERLSSQDVFKEAEKVGAIINNLPPDGGYSIRISYEPLTKIVEAVKKASEIRAMFSNPDPKVRLVAVRATIGLSKLPFDEETRLARAVFAMFEDPDKEVRAHTIVVGAGLGQGLCSKLPSDGLVADAEKIIAIISRRQDDDILDLIWCLAGIVKRLPPEVVASRARELREKFDDPDPRTRETAIHAYGAFAVGMTPDEAAEGVKALRAIFLGPNSAEHRPAVSSYQEVSERLNQDGSSKEIVALWAKFDDPDPRIIINTMSAFSRLAKVLTPKAAAKSAKMLRTKFSHKDEGVRNAAVDLYNSLPIGLTEDSATEEARLCREMFGDQNPDVICTAMRAYETLVDKLSSTEALEGARKFREMFKSSNDDVIYWAVLAYELLVGKKKITIEEAAEGARALRMLLDNSKSGSVKYAAERALSSLKSKYNIPNPR